MEILIIENNTSKLEGLTSKVTSFHEQQYRVSNVSTLEQAVTKVGQILFDIVFVDLNLPEFETIDVIFELKQVLDCPIVVIFEDGQEDRIEDAIAKGAADTLSMTHIDAGKVKQVISHSVGRYKLEQEKQKLIGELVEASFENQKILDQLQEAHAQLLDEIALRSRTESKNELLVKAIHQISDEVVISDLEHRVLYRNRAVQRKFSMTADSVAALAVAELFAPGNEEVFRQMEECLVSGEEWRGKSTRTDEEGHIRTEQLSVFPIRDDEEKIINYVAIRRDVTRETDLEKRLLQSQKSQSIGQLAAGIAHEINTPTQYVSDNVNFLGDSFESLAKILGQHRELVEQVRNGEPSNRLDEFVSRCAKAIEEEDIDFLQEEIPLSISQSADGLSRIAKIVLAMKEFSCPETDEKVPADLNQAIRSTVQVCANEWKYVADLEVELEAGLPLVPCFIGELNQVILNMVVNSAHAIAQSNPGGAEKGIIRIETKSRINHVLVIISDSGCGIAPEIIDKVFDPFFTTKDVGKGIGQGLSMAYSTIVDIHSGSIEVESEPGEGTAFQIRLPLRQ